MHPMLFLRKITRTLDEAAVPEDRKVGLAVACLRQSAADWALAKEGTFINFNIFVEAFKKQYWNADKERELFYDIRYGKFKTGSRADYFIKLAGQAAFLTESLQEKYLVKCLFKHFSPDILRGAVMSNICTTEEAEEFLKKIDITFYDSDTNKRRSIPPPRHDSCRGQPLHAFQSVNENSNHAGVDDRQNVTSSRAIRSLQFDDCLLSDDDEVTCADKLLSPLLEVVVVDRKLQALQCCAISESFADWLQVEVPTTPVLPITNTVITVAFGGKTKKIKKTNIVDCAIRS